MGEIVVLGETVPVWSPYAGVLMGMTALPGERLRAGQPVAWLRAAFGA